MEPSVLFEHSVLLDPFEPDVEPSVLLESLKPDEPHLARIAPPLTIMKIITNNGGKALFIFTDGRREYHYVNNEVCRMKEFAGYTGH